MWKKFLTVGLDLEFFFLKCTKIQGVWTGGGCHSGQIYCSAIWTARRGNLYRNFSKKRGRREERGGREGGELFLESVSIEFSSI
jgi:hypothetical protein